MVGNGNLLYVCLSFFVLLVFVSCCSLFNLLQAISYLLLTYQYKKLKKVADGSAKCIYGTISISISIST